MSKRVSRSFFARPTVEVARDMLGKVLCRRIGNALLRVRITEVEAYCGEQDKACHASKGKTARTAPMYARPGTTYVYLVYGMYHCFNVVTERVGFPAAVLIRGCKPISKTILPKDVTGPGRLCRTLAITKQENNQDLIRNRSLWIADDGVRIIPHKVTRTPRIGVEYAEESASLPWRFMYTENEKLHTSERSAAKT